MDDELYETPELDEELSYSFVSQEIQKEIMSEWKKLKQKFYNHSEDLEESVKRFDKLLNYFY